MKTKKRTKQRRQLRDFEVANRDLEKEFGGTYKDYDVIDELALAEIEEWDE